MSNSPYSFDVTEQDFQTVVLENSFRLPVLVDFWATWCQPCQMLAPLLARLVQAYQGSFILAKVDTDKEQRLAAQFGVRGLPTVKVFRTGQVVDELVGMQPESAYRAVIERYQVKESERLLKQAELARHRGQRDKALNLLRKAQALEPDNSTVQIALAGLWLEQGDIEPARDILLGLPLEERMNEPASGLLARLEFFDKVKEAPPASVLEQKIQSQPADCLARRQLGAHKVLEGDYEAALEQFLEILRRNPQFADGAGRKDLLSVFNILGSDHPLVNSYRRKMATFLH